MAYLHQINRFDMDNDFGEGPVVSVFFNFCPFHCKNCWNQATWARDEALYWDNDDVVGQLEDAITVELINRGMKPNLSLLGGDPLVDENIEDTLYIIRELRKRIPNLRVASWTGYDIEMWYKKPEQYTLQFDATEVIDIIIDGRFIDKLKTKNQMFGSVNQRVIETKKLYSDSNMKKVINQAMIHKTDMLLLNYKGKRVSSQDLMNRYIDSDKDRMYQLSILHQLREEDL